MMLSHIKTNLTKPALFLFDENDISIFVYVLKCKVFRTPL